MYVVNVSYGDVDDEPERSLTDTLGTYKTLDEACAAAKRNFDAILMLLGNDPDIHYFEVTASFDDYSVIYGYIDPKLGYVYSEQYYRVSVVER